MCVYYFCLPFVLWQWHWWIKPLLIVWISKRSAHTQSHWSGWRSKKGRRGAVEHWHHKHWLFSPPRLNCRGWWSTDDFLRYDVTVNWVEKLFTAFNSRREQRKQSERKGKIGGKKPFFWMRRIFRGSKLHWFKMCVQNCLCEQTVTNDVMLKV